MKNKIIESIIESKRGVTQEENTIIRGYLKGQKAGHKRIIIEDIIWDSKIFSALMCEFKETSFIYLTNSSGLITLLDELCNLGWVLNPKTVNIEENYERLGKKPLKYPGLLLDRTN